MNIQVPKKKKIEIELIQQDEQNTRNLQETTLDASKQVTTTIATIEREQEFEETSKNMNLSVEASEQDF